MDDAELVGAVLYQVEDPVSVAIGLANLLASGPCQGPDARALDLEPSLVDALRHSLPADPEAIRLACAKGAAWVLGRRSVVHPGTWELVATLPASVQLPSGLRRTTAETLIGLVAEATHSLRLTAPYVDPEGIGFLAEAIAAATARTVEVEVLRPARGDSATQAMEALRRTVSDLGHIGRLRTTRLVGDAPFAHLKVAVADGHVAYIGSANLTGAGLAGRNLELGVIVRGGDVVVIERILDLYRG